MGVLLRVGRWNRCSGVAGVALWMLLVRSDAAPVSYTREVAPILDRSCAACHQPVKLKGGLDLTTFAALSNGGKHGPALVARAPATSKVITQVKGLKPEMPPEGKPLTVPEVATLERWIAEGAVDDTPATSARAAGPVRYDSRPVITSLAWSPDGATLAVPGNGEVFLVSVDGYERRFRLRGAAARVESVQFSPDGRILAVAGGTPSRFGELQFWKIATGELERSIRVGGDSVFGVNWSPDGTRVAVGGADRTVRVFEVSSGLELVRFDQHTDWVFGACFTLDGTRVISASRDKTMKLIDAASGQLIDEICRPNEPLLGILRVPHEDVVAGLGGEYRIRVYKALAKPDNNDPNADPNSVREYDGFEGGMTAAAYSPDGKWIATAGATAGEVRVHDAKSGGRKATLRDHEGVVYGIAFSPDGMRLATAGFEGLVRVFQWEKEHLTAVFAPAGEIVDAAR
jgi:roadblock/LC7 domain-containing protein/mono/diheme cytochrome c family protein